MRKFLKILIGTIILLLLIGAVGAFIFYKWYEDAIYTAPSTSADPQILITVEEGDGLFDISKELETSGHLKSDLALRIYLRLNPTDVKVVEGRYRIPKNLAVRELLTLIDKGPIIESVNVRFREGTRMDEFGQVLVSALKDFPEAAFKIDEFNDITNNPDKYTFNGVTAEYLKTVKPAGKSLEGFLFPDTYTVGIDATAQMVVELLVSTQVQKLTAAGVDYKTAKGRLGSFYDNLILASIVERESISATESPTIADIFTKRLRTGEIIGADATLLYPLKNWAHQITAAELRDRNNPYNTRARTGLVPTPICNPSIASITATLNPATTPYLYFLHTADGRTFFARTLSEHNANVRRYL